MQKFVKTDLTKAQLKQLLATNLPQNQTVSDFIENNSAKLLTAKLMAKNSKQEKIRQTV